MNEADRATFLDEPLTAVLSLTTESGAPYAIPVWYRYEEGRFHVWSDRSRFWVQRLQADPRAAITVAEHDSPFAAVIARGEFSFRHDRPGVLQEARRICARYVGEDGVDEYVRQWETLDTILTLAPSWIRSWGRGY
jgi:hypothetical protein